MEKVDQELIQEMMPENPRLKELYREHLQLDKKTNQLERLRGYSTSATLALASLKKKKLSGMDEMMSILKSHRDKSLSDTALA